MAGIYDTLTTEQLQNVANMGDIGAMSALSQRQSYYNNAPYIDMLPEYQPSKNIFDVPINSEIENSTYVEDDGGITEYDTRNIFQKGLDYLSNNRGNIVRGGIGSLLGTALLGPVGGILGSFLGQGIGRRGALQTFGRSNTLMDFVDAMNRQKAVDKAVAAQSSGATGGDTFNFSDNSGYGGTGTSSPSNVGAGGRLGGGV
jgi:hypothetical protein